MTESAGDGFAAHMIEHGAPRRGDWMQTFSGKQFWPLDPRPEEIFIEDIAAALSKQCRYGGHCLDFYSVAEHSMLMCRAAPVEFKKWCLLHDASEAYLVDIPRPTKKHLANYMEIEKRLMRVIAMRFDLSWPMPREVKQLDERIGLTEKRAIMAKCVVPWECDFDAKEPLDVEILCLPPARARELFISEARMHLP